MVIFKRQIMVTWRPIKMQPGLTGSLACSPLREIIRWERWDSVTDPLDTFVSQG